MITDENKAIRFLINNNHCAAIHCRTCPIGSECMRISLLSPNKNKLIIEFLLEKGYTEEELVEILL